jgi:hypothetical protein
LRAVRHEARHHDHIPAGATADVQGGTYIPERKLLHQGLLGGPQFRKGAGRIEKPDQAAGSADEDQIEHPYRHKPAVLAAIRQLPQAN